MALAVPLTPGKLFSLTVVTLSSKDSSVFSVFKDAAGHSRKKLNFTVDALVSSNYSPSLQGIFKLMTVSLSSTETFNLIFQVDPSQWILATAALNKTHLTVLHAIFRWAYYRNVNFCSLISFSGGQYKAHWQMITVFMTKSTQVKFYGCIYNFTTDQKHTPYLNKTTLWPTPCSVWQYQETPMTVQLIFFFF